MNKIFAGELNYLFPGAFMVNTFAMTILMVMLGVFGKSEMAAEIGIIQGATLALFYAFSANARSLIFNPSSKISAELIIVSRLFLLMPLSGAAFLLSIVPAKIDIYLAIALIFRRCVEWLGEVHLSEKERLGDKKFTWNYLILQVGLLIGVLAWFLSDLPFPLLGLFIWALAPLTMSAGYIWKSFVAVPGALVRVSSSLLPHLGSTTIIGVTVYIFRILILLLVGRATAGDLFTAYAIGGLTGGVFANALGPSVILHEQRSGKRRLPFMLNVMLYLCFFSGLIIFTTVILKLPILEWTGKSNFFWMATGLSMIGGVIMVHAQRIRLRLLQNGEEHDVFGPDVLMNILLIAAIPFAYYIVGIKAMSGLYLLSSLLAFVFYTSSKYGNHLEQRSTLVSDKIKAAIPLMLLFPVFFQISNGLFRDKTINFNSGGVLANLPLPLSVLACYAGIVFRGRYRRAFVSVSIIFLTCILMAMAAIFSTQTNPVQQQAKLILVIQFILPMFALILGQAYSDEAIGNNDFCYQKMFLWVLAIIIPWHLAATFYQGFIYLAPSLGLFSIYQYLEYVPVVLVSAYLVALFALWQFPRYKLLLLLLALPMGIYVAASISMLAISMLLIGLFGFAVFQWISHAEKLPANVFLMVTVLSVSYLYYAISFSEQMAFQFVSSSSLNRLHSKNQQNSQALTRRDMPVSFMEPDGCKEDKRKLEQTKLQLSEKVVSFSRQRERLEKLSIPVIISDHMNHWQYYIERITATPKTLLIGNRENSNCAEHPSAYNYYLDFVYNFGLIALVPIFAILMYTCFLIFRNMGKIYHLPDMIGLSFATLFLLLIDNFLKVGLRQPYPGIFAFFLWGILLNRLLYLNNAKVSCNET